MLHPVEVSPFDMAVKHSKVSAGGEVAVHMRTEVGGFGIAADDESVVARGIGKRRVGDQHALRGERRRQSYASRT